MIRMRVGADTIVATTTRLQGRVSDLRPVARERFNPDLDRFFTAQFDSRGAAGGEPWAPLSPNTVRARAERSTKGRARFGSRRGRALGGLYAALWDSGRLRSSLVKSQGPESVSVMQPLRFERGSTVPYLRFHQAGYTVSRWGRNRFSPRRVPARRLAPERLPPAMLAGWEAALVAHITRI